MSASLVGSEMCIRDRLHEDHSRCMYYRLGRGLLRRDRTAFVRRCGPVSYTHLTLPTICSV
eukprot:5931172-Alexandrium_andersonii.AAC.1